MGTETPCCLPVEIETNEHLITNSNFKKISRSQVMIDIIDKKGHIAIYEYDIVKRFIDNDNIKNNPVEILLIITKYLGVIIRRFDVCPQEYIDDIKNNGSVIQRSKHLFGTLSGKRKTLDHILYDYHSTPFLFGCSNGFKSNTGIHRWAIKIIKFKNTTDWEGTDTMGIVSDYECLKNQIKKEDSNNDYDNFSGHNTSIGPPYYSGWSGINVSAVDCNSYFMTLSNRNDIEIKIHQPIETNDDDINYDDLVLDPYTGHFHVENKTNDIDVRLNSDAPTKIVENDVITINLDSNRGILHFEMNKQKLCDEIDVDMDKTYYPIIGSVSHGNVYERVLTF